MHQILSLVSWIAFGYSNCVCNLNNFWINFIIQN